MRLTKHTDLGLQMLMYLALKPDELHSVADLSKKFGASRNHLVKVANRIVKLGYASSTRGRFGGIQLAIPAKKIRIEQVIEDLEQSLEVVDCTDCPYVIACRLKVALKGAMQNFIASMNDYTLADLVKENRKLIKLVG